MRGRRIPLRTWLALALIGGAAMPAAGQTVGGWPSYGGAPGGGHYSPLKQITPLNVDQLEVAWTYHTGDYSAGGPGHRTTTFEATPVLANGNLFICTPYNRVIALNAETGAEIWSHEPEPKLDRAYDQQHSLICRGVSYWEDTNAPSSAPCARRIFQGVLDGRLEALDATSGALCADFGKGGTLNLNDFPNSGKGVVNVTSPPVIFEDLVIVGTAIGDNQRVDLPAGIVRAFDARTGQERWSWNPIPEHLRAKVGAANVWAPMSVDGERGVLFVPTTSPSPDFWGGFRTEDIPYANALVALNARDGSVIWHRQIVHHDLFDYDLPAQPTLLDVRRDGRLVAAVAQATKTGFLYVLDRATGEPLFPLTERGVPDSTVEGERASPTQPVPLLPKPLARQGLKPEDVFGITPIDRAWCMDKIRTLRNDGLFTPPSLEGSVYLPFAGGGSNWGGIAFDPRSRLVIANVMNLAQEVKLFPTADFAKLKEQSPGGIEFARQTGAPFGMERGLIMSPLGVPCSRPPWGTIAAIDIDTGETRWQTPFGATPLGVLGLHAPEAWGAPNLGGAVVTGSGLIFIGATADSKLRAINIWTGAVLWEDALPFPGVATPMTYQLAPEGRQYVVIAAGGSALLQSAIGDALVAYALPKP